MPLRVIAIRLDRPLLTGSSSLPGSQTQRAAAPPLFGLAPRGVCHAGRITAAAVRSYRTFSPLPAAPKHDRRYILCGTFRRRRLEPVPPAVSRRAALWRPDFPPAFASGYPSGEHPRPSVASDVDAVVVGTPFPAALLPVHILAGELQEQVSLHAVGWVNGNTETCARLQLRGSAGHRDA